MRIHLIAVGTRMPGWVTQAYGEYAKRLPRENALTLVEIAPVKRTTTTDTAKALTEEGKRMLAAVPKQCEVVALEVDGSAWSTEVLATQMQRWQQGGRDIALLVGGADGLAPACRARATQSWSLSALTLPHALVRVVVAEQLYRAWTLLNGHPYHRA